ncbi:hypothetical protein PAP_04490 [Palaeococcus pacificus DY20341]|uniref:Taxis protein n=1 Tax=Palaeococcus pacificus DY20341 TaxID=1343739 RepID=A0A075LSM5_9EURY|nr:CheF family chemotaxis protein [Palaeococcus pacificus]AIF69309.1 hypothetical protein PAP_04490 [Palaeococcus pacificus DY20341]
MKLRAKATILSSWKSTTHQWRDVIAELNKTGIILNYVKRGEVIKKEMYGFSNLVDVGMNIPDEVKLNPTRDHFGLKFRIRSGEIYLLLTLGENPLIFDIKEFENFIDSIFMAILDGKKAMLQFARSKGGAINMDSKWDEAMIRIVSAGGKRDAFIVQGKKVISLFRDLEDMEIEEVELGEKTVKALKLTHNYKSESVTSYLYIPSRKLTLFLIRYILLHGPESRELMEKIADEFGEIKRDIEEELQRELKELMKISPEKQQILLALYSGINPLEIHQFLGIREEDVERIYDEMIDEGLLKIVMIRKIVDLTMDGRKIVNKLIKLGNMEM